MVKNCFVIDLPVLRGEIAANMSLLLEFSYDFVDILDWLKPLIFNTNIKGIKIKKYDECLSLRRLYSGHDNSESSQVFAMVDTSKIRMNLAAIKKVDPYAKEIVDTSSHVAFYTFNPDSNEWEKTDVEGAFFVYTRNGEPYHSIFINNRLNTNSFVEPITGQLELQVQSPFLLYRNERSRIRGFWFYNSQECERIGNFINGLVHKLDNHKSTEVFKEQQNGILNMLSKAQLEFQSGKKETRLLDNAEPCSVVKFFAAVKPTNSEDPLQQKILQTTLSVNQIEKQQMDKSQTDFGINKNLIHLSTDSTGKVFSATDTLDNSISSANATRYPANSDNAKLCTDLEMLKQISMKPMLIPPNMFSRSREVDINTGIPKYLNKTQLVQAFTYLIQNDSDFVQKLHEAYLYHTQ